MNERMLSLPGNNLDLIIEGLEDGMLCHVKYKVYRLYIKAEEGLNVYYTLECMDTCRERVLVISMDDLSG